MNLMLGKRNSSSSPGDNRRQARAAVVMPAVAGPRPADPRGSSGGNLGGGCSTHRSNPHRGGTECRAHTCRLPVRRSYFSRLFLSSRVAALCARSRRRLNISRSVSASARGTPYSCSQAQLQIRVFTHRQLSVSHLGLASAISICTAAGKLCACALSHLHGLC